MQRQWGDAAADHTVTGWANLSQGSKASAEHVKGVPGSLGKTDSSAPCPASAGDDSDADGPTLEQI